MREFSAEKMGIGAESPLETVKRAQVNSRYPAFIGLDMHN